MMIFIGEVYWPVLCPSGGCYKLLKRLWVIKIGSSHTIQKHTYIIVYNIDLTAPFDKRSTINHIAVVSTKRKQILYNRVTCLMKSSGLSS